MWGSTHARVKRDKHLKDSDQTQCFERGCTAESFIGKYFRYLYALSNNSILSEMTVMTIKQKCNDIWNIL